MKDSSHTSPEAEETARLVRAVDRVMSHRYVRLHDNPAKMLAFQFARGLAFGLGTVMGGGLLVSLLVVLLSQIEVIPIIGQWATQLIEEIQPETNATGSASGPAADTNTGSSTSD